MSAQLQRRESFLSEMGIGPVWTLRDAAAAIGAPVDEVPELVQASAPAAEFIPAPALKPVKVAESAWSDDPVASARPIAPVAPKAPRLPRAATGPSPEEIAEMSFAELKAAVAGCTRCGLCKGRTKTVFGVGDEKAKWLFIGEGPGRNEDQQGEPFVGPAGKLLDNMLVAIGLKRGANAYIANVVKCRPTGPDGRDRPPTAEEAEACAPYLQRQVALIQPSIIVALGKSAAVSLLKLDATVAVSSLRGKLHRYAGRPLVVTYHPAYLLRTPVDKRKSWADLSLAMQTYAASAE